MIDEKSNSSNFQAQHLFTGYLRQLSTSGLSRSYRLGRYRILGVELGSSQAEKQLVRQTPLLSPEQAARTFLSSLFCSTYLLCLLVESDRSPYCVAMVFTGASKGVEAVQRNTAFDTDVLEFHP